MAIRPARAFTSREDARTSLARMRESAYDLSAHLPLAARDQHLAVQAHCRQMLGQWIPPRASLTSQRPGDDVLATRMFDAAFTCEILIRCPHQADNSPERMAEFMLHPHPIFLFCDPPILTCGSCWERHRSAWRGLNVVWQGQCDACGALPGRLFRLKLASGALIISGSVCYDCREPPLG